MIFLSVAQFSLCISVYIYHCINDVCSHICCIYYISTNHYFRNMLALRNFLILCPQVTQGICKILLSRKFWNYCCCSTIHDFMIDLTIITLNKQVFYHRSDYLFCAFSISIDISSMYLTEKRKPLLFMSF